MSDFVLNGPEIDAAPVALIYRRRETLLFSERHLAFRSPSTRFGWTSFAAAVCAAVASIFFGGCQSGAQYDQVARELRLQEDELYALEDYVEQYQQLVCKYRSENAALRRQLAENGVTPSTSRPSKRPGPTPAGPSIEPKTPTEDVTPPSDIDVPDVPPLEATTSHNSNSRGRHARSRGRAKLAGAKIAGEDSAVTRAVAMETVESNPAASDVWLHGEVLANNSDGGIRMLAEVEPLDAEGQAIEFHGALSLLLIAPNEEGVKLPVARWDYGPQDVRAAADAEGQGKTLRFQLALPPETQPAEGTELWVRLLQRGGAKVLAHAQVAIHEPGLFSSRSDAGSEDGPSLLGPRKTPIAAGADEDGRYNDPSSDQSLPSTVATVGSEMFDGGWTVATPGHPAGISDANQEAKSDWRATLDLPPSVTASRAAAKPRPSVRRPRESVDDRDMTTRNTKNPSPWSPSRSHGAAASSRSATRPTWSATR